LFQAIGDGKRRTKADKLQRSVERLAETTGDRMDFKPQTGYECFDELIRQLRAEGHIEPADKLYMLLHEVAWTTGS